MRTLHYKLLVLFILVFPGLCWSQSTWQEAGYFLHDKEYHDSSILLPAPGYIGTVYYDIVLPGRFKVWGGTQAGVNWRPHFADICDNVLPYAYYQEEVYCPTGTEIPTVTFHWYSRSDDNEWYPSLLDTEQGNFNTFFISGTEYTVMRQCIEYMVEGHSFVAVPPPSGGSGGGS